ncbi:hypothetical protein [Paraburkholderia xenovorans]
MTRLPVFVTLVATGVPLAGALRWPVATLAIGATVLLLTGVNGKSLRTTVVGAVLAIAELALALTSLQPELILLRPIAVGLALLYLIEEVGYAERVATAHIDAAAQSARSHARMRLAIAAMATSALVAALASGFAAYLPSNGSARMVVGGIGAIAALLAALVGALGLALKKRRTVGLDRT